MSRPICGCNPHRPCPMGARLFRTRKMGALRTHLIAGLRRAGSHAKVQAAVRALRAINAARAEEGR